MVCEVCSVDRSDEDGELIILDYPRYLASENPCPNCGSVVTERVKKVTLSDLTELAIARRRSRSAVPLGIVVGA